MLVAGRTSVELVLAYLGVLRAGAAMVPADPGSTAGELAHLIADGGAVAAWADAEPLEHLRGPTCASPPRSASCAPRRPRASRWRRRVPRTTSRWSPTRRGRPALRRASRSATANVLASLRAVMGAWRWQRDDVLVHGLPLSHQHGLSGVQIGLLAGSRAVLLERFEPARLCDAVEREGATVVFAVPAMYERLLDWEGFASADAGLACACGSRARRRSRRASPARLSERARRAAARALRLDRDRPQRVQPRTTGRAGPGSVGLPLPGLEVALADDGEILLRGPQVFAGYWEQPDTTADAFTDDGWFRTGDVGAARSTARSPSPAASRR